MPSNQLRHIQYMGRNYKGKICQEKNEDYDMLL